MCRGWKGVALVAVCWCLNLPLQAQTGTYPSPVGAARMPEPIPCGPSQGPPPPQMPNLIPGPIGPQAAPMGPPNSLSLPADHSSAFQCEEYVQESGFFVHVGPMALQRSKLGAGDIAVYNARAQGQPIGPVVPNPFLPAVPGTASALNFNSFTPAMSLGIRGTVGYLWDNQSIEFSSFYIWENDVTTDVKAPLGLDTLFYNPPLTFVGNGLWRRSDQVSTIFGSSLFNAEVNYRRWNSAFAGLDLLFGVRYLRQNDALDIVSQGTAFFNNSMGLPPGRDVGVYEVLTHNNIVAPQLGLEYNLPIFSWLSLAGMGKGAWGVNFIDKDVSLTRGDGLTAFDTHSTATVFGQVYQLAGFADFNLMQRLRLRLGFQATWITGVATANDQVDFNLMGAQGRQAFLANNPALVGQPITVNNFQNFRGAQQSIPHGQDNNNGSILYFGPLLELQFFF